MRHLNKISKDMETTTRKMAASKRIALVAHDHKKSALIEWSKLHKAELDKHQLFGTGTTGTLLSQHGFAVEPLLSGPMGGDQQLGAMIAEGKIDVMIFFWDPLDAVPHDPDVKALLRLAAVWNIPVATNKATADILLASRYFDQEFEVEVPDYAGYLKKRTQ